MFTQSLFDSIYSKLIMYIESKAHNVYRIEGTYIIDYAEKVY